MSKLKCIAGGAANSTLPYWPQFICMEGLVEKKERDEGGERRGQGVTTGLSWVNAATVSWTEREELEYVF